MNLLDFKHPVKKAIWQKKSALWIDDKTDFVEMASRSKTEEMRNLIKKVQSCHNQPLIAISFDQKIGAFLLQ